MLDAGQDIDRYRVEALLGEGGMAEVYRVRHRTLGSAHALKVLKLDTRGITDRLVQEGQVQASLRHPNVVTVTDVIEVAGKPGLVMEFISGPTLAQWLANTQPTIEEAEALFLGILAGVSRAHRLGLVHRDLKPGNVLLEETDEGFVPKVADFGLAKLLAEQGGRFRTRSGIPMGTPAYMAPEQVRDAASVDQRADIFALGCILYELVCRVPPFDAPDALGIFARLARGEYTPAESLVPTLPERFRRAIRGCLAVEREDRLPDCAAVRALFVGQEPSESSSAHVVPLRDPAPRHTVANTLEPAGHGRVSASQTFADDGVAGTRSPGATMAPLSEAGSIAPRTLDPEAAGPAPARPRGGPRTEPPDEGPRGGLWTWIAGVIGLGGLAALAVALVALAAWTFRPTEPGVTPAPRPVDVRPKPPVEVIPEVPTNEAPAADVAPVVEAVRGAPDPAPLPDGLGASPKPAPAPSVGSVVFTGDADEVWLEREGTRVGNGDLAPGDYAVRARFGAETVPGGTVRVRAGEALTVHCAAAFKLCRLR